MKIDKIKKVSGNQYKIQLSNKETLSTYDEVILKNNLLFHNEIDSSLLNKIELDTKYYGVYNKVIKFITTRLRSKKEILVFLDKNNVTDEDRDKIISELERVGLINERNFAKAYISDKLYLSNYGPDKIKNDLYDYGIDTNIVEDEVAKIDNTVVKEKLNKLVLKKIKANRKYSNYQLKQKIIFELGNIGYNSDMIIEIFDSLNMNSDSILKKQFEKVYTKLSKKYVGKELYYKVKQSLYQKGFDTSEIDELLNKKVETY